MTFIKLISSEFCRSHLLDEETEEDFITDILQEVVSNALDSIYHKIVQSKVIPYTVNAARELLLETIEVGCYLIFLMSENDWKNLLCHSFLQ